MVVAEVRPADMPVEILGLEIERERRRGWRSAVRKSLDGRLVDRSVGVSSWRPACRGLRVRTLLTAVTLEDGGWGNGASPAAPGAYRGGHRVRPLRPPLDVDEHLLHSVRRGGYVDAGALLRAAIVPETGDLQPLARLASWAVAGAAPASWASARSMPPEGPRSTALGLDDMGVIDLNEAFAAQALAMLRTLVRRARRSTTQPQRLGHLPRPPGRRDRRPHHDHPAACDGSARDVLRPGDHASAAARDSPRCSNARDATSPYSSKPTLTADRPMRRPGRRRRRRPSTCLPPSAFVAVIGSRHMDQVRLGASVAVVANVHPPSDTSSGGTPPLVAPLRSRST